MTDAITTSRRTLLGAGALAGAAIVAAPAAAGERDADRGPTEGDVAILRFLAFAETVEADLWLQYAELGGVQARGLPGLPTGGSATYTAALKNLDGDMDQYISDNTDDEISHQAFINAYLAAHGAEPVDLGRFRTLPSSRATGARQIGRLTNLMQLTVDTSWYTRYRSGGRNPDLDPGFRFPPAVRALAEGRFPAIPRSDADLAPTDHVQAIANTAAFHFCAIEQGGSSLYPTLAQNVTDAEVLRILLSIGPTETAHFQTWHDKAGNAVQPPLAPLTDPTDSRLTFPNLNAPPFPAERFQANLILPEPCPFLSRKYPAVSIIRPTSAAEGGAVAAVAALSASGLFIGQSREFLELAIELAFQADEARRGSA